MKKKAQAPLQLLDPQQALHAYLDALLSEVPDSLEETLEATAPAPNLPQDAAPPLPIATEARLLPGLEATTEVRPAWAEGEFQALCFKVAGVTLATPLAKLNGIVELNDALTELPGYAPWVMGLLSNRGQQTQVVDLAHIILPENRKAEAGDPQARVHYVILVNDGQFGLGADSLAQVITLQPDQVRWRTANSRRPWLAGMVIDRMCAILDIEHLTGQLGATSGARRDPKG